MANCHQDDLIVGVVGDGMVLLILLHTLHKLQAVSIFIHFNFL
jgi:hypothetical protein